jgi:methionyl-tRNA formyltransferase
MRLVFMGTPRFAVPPLRELLSSSHRVEAVITQPDRPSGRGNKVGTAPVKQVALEVGLPLYQPDKLKEEAWRDILQRLDADAYVVVAYGKILPEWLIELPRLGAINLHASLLPKYRGAAPINWAIISGETATGVTTMRIDKGLDTGDILLQVPVQIGPGEYASELHDRLSFVGAELMVKTLDLLEKGEIKPIPQRAESATYAPLLRKSDGQLDWSQEAVEIHNRVRGLNPWPGAYTFLKCNLLQIWKANPLSGGIATQPPGTLVHWEMQRAVVHCSSGLLELKELQFENRRRVSASDFLNGIRLSKDQSLLLGAAPPYVL